MFKVLEKFRKNQSNFKTIVWKFFKLDKFRKTFWNFKKCLKIKAKLKEKFKKFWKILDKYWVNFAKIIEQI